jgi:hypothetical protein
MRSFARIITALVLLANLSASASACPLCKEAVSAQPDDSTRLQDGFNYSILFMLAMPFTVLGTGVFLVARAARRGELPEM